jgi:hypothetical protein
MDLDNDAFFLQEDEEDNNFFENIKWDGKSANISAKDAIPEIKALKVKVLKPTDKTIRYN